MVQLTSVAIRAHHLQAMADFYTRAFGFTFRAVNVGGLRCLFGELEHVTLKLVPLRSGTDFEAFPMHQLGFQVDDVAGVLEIAQACGGQQHGEIVRSGGRAQAAVRDPDGNPIELYQDEQGHPPS